MRLLVTGGAGFIGSNFVRCILEKRKDIRIIVLDALTYAGNLDNFPGWVWEDANFCFFHGDIRDETLVRNLMRNTDKVIHFAAETHVDRSIDNSDPFISTDIKGTQVLLETIRKEPVERFIHISTSEVYGTTEKVPMDEEHPLKPQSPYAAAKAGADRLAYSFFFTYDLPLIIIRPFNNYGPNQFPEKLIPLFITNAMEEKPLPVYGTGKNTRDWIYVKDCVKAFEKLLDVDVKKIKGEVINLGSGKDTNVLTIADTILGELGKDKSLIKFVADRLGHVKRHISSTEKAKKVIGWEAETDFQKGLISTIKWYKENEEWLRKIKEGKREYKEIYEKWYRL
ncbi:MAG: dTDP-glucose 4,6-dehydratase [Candidatus Cloacimonadota bacterium]|nr:MAG: dTDP-glucose 4,6-dehydratase [Candidatus Cloacimonadota bacterium]